MIMSQMTSIGPTVLLICLFLCLYRVVAGPGSADRIAASYVLGLLVIGLCALSVALGGAAFLLDIAISWAILGFLGTIAFAKYLEGKNLDE